MKVAVVTGAGSGMGEACVRAFAEAGYEVAMLGRRDIAEGKGCHYYKCDVSNYEEIQSIVADIKGKYGHVDVLINAAGVFKGGIVEDNTEEDYEYLFGINVKGTFLMMKELLPIMGPGSSVVNIASSSGQGGDYNATLYGSSKAAVIGMTRCAAMDYAAKGIRINAIAPSATETPMFLNGSTQAVIDSFKNNIPDHSIGTPEQIANVAMFLSSDMAQHVVGQVIAVDGGLQAWNGQPRQDKTTEH